MRRFIWKGKIDNWSFVCLQDVSQNGYFSAIAAMQPFAVPNTDQQRLLPTFMSKDNIKTEFRFVYQGLYVRTKIRI